MNNRILPCFTSQDPSTISLYYVYHIRQCYVNINDKMSILCRTFFQKKKYSYNNFMLVNIKHELFLVTKYDIYIYLYLSTINGTADKIYKII